jgi:hypothetical protein
MIPLISIARQTSLPRYATDLHRWRREMLPSNEIERDGGDDPKLVHSSIDLVLAAAMNKVERAQVAIFQQD